MYNKTNKEITIMTKKYDIEFKKQLVHAYMQGTSYPQLEKEYGVAKSTISGWVKKYSEECRYTSKSQYDNPYAKEIHNLNIKIAGLEKENLFLKKAAAFFAKETG